MKHVNEILKKHEEKAFKRGAEIAIDYIVEGLLVMEMAIEEEAEIIRRCTLERIIDEMDTHIRG